MTTRRRLAVAGAVAWSLQPLYIVVEIVVGLRASADYSFADSTISDLGNTACRQVRGDVLCSPWHTGMNIAFSWFGLTLALGALLWGTTHLTRWAGRSSVVLWCVAGIGSFCVGLFPVNVDPTTHGIVALPIFIAQPTALLLMAVSLRATRPRIAAATVIITVVAAIGSIGFGMLVGRDVAGIGTFERIALWSGYLWVSVVVLTSVVGGHAEHGTRRQVQ